WFAWRPVYSREAVRRKRRTSGVSPPIPFPAQGRLGLRRPLRGVAVPLLRQRPCLVEGATVLEASALRVPAGRERLGQGQMIRRRVRPKLRGRACMPESELRVARPRRPARSPQIQKRQGPVGSALVERRLRLRGPPEQRLDLRQGRNGRRGLLARLHAEGRPQPIVAARIERSLAPAP